MRDDFGFRWGFFLPFRSFKCHKTYAHAILLKKLMCSCVKSALFSVLISLSMDISLNIEDFELVLVLWQSPIAIILPHWKFKNQNLDKNTFRMINQMFLF